jgi:ABC-type sugar transport system ATPase subunit
MCTMFFAQILLYIIDMNNELINEKRDWNKKFQKSFKVSMYVTHNSLYIITMSNKAHTSGE